MAKYPSLTKEQKKSIAKFKDSPKKPSEIAKEINIPPKQIGGYLHYLRRPNILNPGVNPKQTQAKPEQIKPSPSRPEGPKKEEVKIVAIEQSDLEKIQKMINDTTTVVQQKTIELTKQSTQDAVAHALTNFQETEKREKESREAAAKLAQSQAQIDNFCKQFPELCGRVDTLEKKAKKPEEPKKEIHSTAKEYLECPECSSALIRAMGKMTKTSPEFAKKIQESLKVQGITLEMPKEEEPKHEEKPGEEPKEGLF